MWRRCRSTITIAHQSVAATIRHPSSLSKSNITRKSKFNIQGTIQSTTNGNGIKVGQYATLHRTYTHHDIHAFAALSGDYNTVHFPDNNIRLVDDDEEIQLQHDNIMQQTTQGKAIVHGILLSSVFSTIFGTLLPGCMYRSQSLKFHNPVYADEHVIGKVAVTQLRQINRSSGGVLCMCDTTLHKIDTNNKKDEHMLCISGEAQVWLPGVKIDS